MTGGAALFRCVIAQKHQVVRLRLLGIEAIPLHIKRPERADHQHRVQGPEERPVQDHQLLCQESTGHDEPIVFVAAASAHRQAAFDACAFVMDYLKTRAPFWKKENTPQGSRWVEGRSSDHDAALRWK
jgi:hypothetical protein